MGDRIPPLGAFGAGQCYGGPPPSGHDPTPRYRPGVAAPVLLVHGWGSSFERTWVATGVSALLEDAGRTVIGVDLLGHGAAPKPHDPDAYADLTGRLVDALPEDGPVDAVGFSLGALTVLELATRTPERFGRIVLAGIGDRAFERDEDERARIVAGVRGRAADGDVHAQAFRHYAEQPGNDPEALAAVLERGGAPFTEDRLAAVTCPVLVVLGDRDFARPGDRLVAALPDARLVTLRNVDHFATPESFTFIDAMLGFLDAIPA
jgi:pimeloyl-ACP methyl ester carboxylesterase